MSRTAVMRSSSGMAASAFAAFAKPYERWIDSQWTTSHACASTAERSPAASYGARRAWMSGRWRVRSHLSVKMSEPTTMASALCERARSPICATIASACAWWRGKRW